MAHRDAPAMQDNAVLAQRILTTEGNISRLAEDTARQIRDLATNTSQQISGLANQIGKLDNSLQERGKIQWPAFALLLSAITAIGWLAYNPINAAQTRMEVAITKLAENSPSYREIDAAAKRRDDWQSNSTERFKRIESDMAEIEKAIVPRGEHAEKWRSADLVRVEEKRSMDLQMANVQRQIDALKADFSGLYSPRDALTSMQRRLEDLERRLLRGAGS